VEHSDLQIKFYKRVAIILNNIGRRLAKQRGCKVAELGVSPEWVAGIAWLIVLGHITPKAGDEIFTAHVNGELGG
jgi:hypothetical protein